MLGHGKGASLGYGLALGQFNAQAQLKPGGVGQAKVEDVPWSSTKQPKKKGPSTAATEDDTRAKADMAIFPRFETNAGAKQGWVPLLEVYQEQLRSLWLTTADGHPRTIEMSLGGYEYEITLFAVDEPVKDETTVGCQRNTFNDSKRDVRIIIGPQTPAD